ncbi:hypothetical protein [Pseudoruegeria sp. SHC-113]|uniref:hypothetical protein n=1 Tax=Pseudoruegeria sp. SHC-113 TaxID=2855439 RepID=UPI0021BA8004|nr:hypothetical protein [Pseudoruegeria sp. SHC-113]MCT8159218.1 hypothetical protein [Pseudoruegeria sp. SHC-113]
MTLLPSDRSDDTRATLTALWLALLINAFICDPQVLLGAGGVMAGALAVSLGLILLGTFLPRRFARVAHGAAALLMLAELAALPLGAWFALSQAAGLLAVLWLALRWQGREAPMHLARHPALR